MSSFYGGRYGKSFQIKKIFSSKVSLEEDLNLNENSTVFPNDLVFISYGDRGSSKYSQNVQKDIDKYQKNYNNTIWQKIYDSSDLENIEIITSSTNNNLHYYLLAIITGSTPTLSVKETIAVENGEEAYVIIDNSNADNPQLTFGLPKGNAATIEIGEVSTVEQEEEPSVINVGTSTDAIFNFKLPQGKEGPAGPAGPALNITHSFTILSSQGIQDNINDVGNYIYSQLGSYPNNNELIAVSYDDGNDIKSYWYYYINNTWGRAIITGSAESLIEDNYSEQNETNKAYSINFINNQLSWGSF